MGPEFDATKYLLGPLCKCGHDHGDGHSLRYLSGKRQCVLCKRRAAANAYKKKKTQTCTDEERRAFRESRRIWQQANPDKVRAINRAACRKRYHTNKHDPAYRAAYYNATRKSLKKKLEREPWYRLRGSITTRLCRALRGGKGGRSWNAIVGFSVDELRAHLEAQFEPEMTWENYGTYWQVDHIIPVSAFVFSGPDDPNVRRCWALSNLRPLESTENTRKSNKLVLVSPKNKPRRRSA